MMSPNVEPPGLDAFPTALPESCELSADVTLFCFKLWNSSSESLVAENENSTGWPGQADLLLTE